MWLLYRIIINSFFLLVVTVIIIGLFIFPFINNNEGEVKGRILSLKTNDISDRSSSYFDSEENLTVYEIVDAFEYASDDIDVELVFLDLSYVSVSSASAFEIGKSGNHNDAILAYSKVIKSDPNNISHTLIVHGIMVR